mgnify:CR=1 FL=1
MAAAAAGLLTAHVARPDEHGPGRGEAAPTVSVAVAGHFSANHFGTLREAAIAACERFVKLHPNHPNVDYAYYLKGLANFNEDLGLLGALANQDLSERDTKAARASFNTFKELVQRFAHDVQDWTPELLPNAQAFNAWALKTMASHPKGSDPKSFHLTPPPEGYSCKLGVFTDHY